MIDGFAGYGVAPLHMPVVLLGVSSLRVVNSCGVDVSGFGGPAIPAVVAEIDPTGVAPLAVLATEVVFGAEPSPAVSSSSAVASGVVAFFAVRRSGTALGVACVIGSHRL